MSHTLVCAEVKITRCRIDKYFLKCFVYTTSRTHDKTKIKTVRYKRQRQIIIVELKPRSLLKIQTLLHVICQSAQFVIIIIIIIIYSFI